MVTAPTPAAPATWRQLVDWTAANSVDIAVALAAGVALVLALVALRGLVRRLLGGAQATGWRQVAEGIAARTIGFFLVMAAARIVGLNAALPVRLADAINILFVIAAALQVAIWTRALILGWIELRIGAGEDNRNLGSAVGLIRVLVTIAAFLIAVIVILDNVGVNVTGLIAGLGIGGIAIGLAAQGIFKDLFAALSIIFDRPFHKGDVIQFGGSAGVTGTVEQIGLRTTRLRALDGEIVAIGNDKLLQDRIHNYALQTRRRAVMTITVMPDTSPSALAELPAGIAAIVATHPLATFERAHVVKLNPSAIDLELVFTMETADYAAFMQTRHEIILALIRHLTDRNIAFSPPPALLPTG